MKKALLLLAIVSVGLLAGCGSGGDAALDKAAPPPTAGAVPEAGNVDKQRPGALGQTSMGDAGMAQPATKPEGM